MRGLFPNFILRRLWLSIPDYLNCMHQADRDLVDSLDTMIENNQLPIWWFNSIYAAQGTEGVQGYFEGCSLGVLNSWCE